MSRAAPIADKLPTDSDAVEARARIWRERPLLRKIYYRYFSEMLAQCARRPIAKHVDATASRPASDYGRLVELGGGSGNFHEFYPPAICTDLLPTSHVQLALDAQRLPFADQSIDNLVMQDVLHHLPYPMRFLAEAQRVLRPGGRLVMTEPYISPVSHMIFHWAHPEPVRMRTTLLASAQGEDPPAFTETGPWASNQASATLLFGRDRSAVLARLPKMKLCYLRRHSMLVYPLSGGFSGPQLLPLSLAGTIWACEKALAPLAALLAFRMLVVLEKQQP